MAERTTTAPDSAKNIEPERPQEGEEALRAALEAYGGDFADAIEYTDELEGILETAILVLASTNDEDVDYVTNSVVALLQAADAVSTEGTVTLAEDVGENSEDLADALESVLALQKDGQLDDLIDLAKMFSALDIDAATVASLNDLLDSVGEAKREPTPNGVLGTLKRLASRDVLAGGGYLVAVLGALGRRVREQ